MNTIDIVKCPIYKDGGILLGYDLGILIDGKAVCTDQFDPIEFITATNKRQKVFIFTCSCGDSGCANIFNGIHQKIRLHTVEWRNMDTVYYTSQRFYSFNKNEFKAAQAKCVRLMYEIINDNEEIQKELIIASGDEYYYPHVFLKIFSESEFLHAIKRRQEWNTRYHLL